MTTDLFKSESIAASYKKYRPNYSEVLYGELTGIIGQQVPGPYQQAVDVGCGSGQFTSGLSPHFKQILGIDVSETQIKEAVKDKTQQNITYQVGSFENIPLSDASCELVTSFLAAHWFEPIQKFYDEADRVLKPGGCLAVGGYGLPSVHHGNGRNNDELHVIFKEFLQAVEKYRLPGNIAVANQYEEWKSPYEESQRMEDLSIVEDMSLQKFVGYLKSYSFYEQFVKNHPDQPDPAEEYCKGVLQELKTDKSPADIQVQVMWRIFYLMGRKPTA